MYLLWSVLLLQALKELALGIGVTESTGKREMVTSP